jgi:hypothetical protein
MLLETMLDYLEFKRLGTQGKNLFIGEMPAACEEGVLLLDRLGGNSINIETPRRRVGVMFSAAVRSRNFNSAKDLATRTFKEITILRPLTYKGIYFQRVMPIEDPRFYRRSAGGMMEFEVEFEATYVLLDPDLPV